MSSQSNKSDAKQRILEAAIKEFSQNSYDGARVDSIAKTAGVSKALIYYNFKNKQEILNEIMEKLFRDSSRLVSDVYETDDADPDSYKITEKGYQANFDFMKKYHEILSIFFMETMKPKGAKKQLIDLFSVTRQERSRILRERGYELVDDPLAIIVEFLFVVMPCYNYSIYYKALMESFGLEEKEINDGFMDVVSTIFNNYVRPVKPVED